MGLLESMGRDILPPEEHELYATALERNGGRLSPIVWARFLKSRLSEQSFIYEAVGDSFYSKYNAQAPAPLVDSIVALAAAVSQQARELSILNYNYDSVIQDQLTLSEIRYSTIYNQATYDRVSELIKLYHVHGFIPSNYEIPESDRHIVFSEDEYHALQADTYHWATLVKRMVFRQYACLFIGFSVADPSVRRIMDAARFGNRRHFCVLRTSTPPSPVIDETARYLDFATSRALSELGVAVIHIDHHQEAVGLIRALLPGC